MEEKCFRNVHAFIHGAINLNPFNDLIRNGDNKMNRVSPPKRLSARRLTLLASAAGLGIAVVATGLSSFSAPSLPSWRTHLA
jgi:hypothetical protein